VADPLGWKRMGPGVGRDKPGWSPRLWNADGLSVGGGGTVTVFGGKTIRRSCRKLEVCYYRFRNSQNTTQISKVLFRKHVIWWSIEHKKNCIGQFDKKTPVSAAMKECL